MLPSVSYPVGTLLLFSHGTLAAPTSSRPLRTEYTDQSSSLRLSTPRYKCQVPVLAISGAILPVRIEVMSGEGFNTSFATLEAGDQGKVLSVLEEDFEGETYI
ncbi:hypothetical protein JCM8547_005592 [Rhodosporidiobolus lusitaniae]